ncbi:MAG TPA: HD domain-containing phosphohydrolase [Dehalococcoidia bacterium]|nr:HD domain-containing phosphohydrolase [Dehalococcoidia bacterium]
MTEDKTNSVTSPAGQLRMADLLGAFSFASDLAVGLHPEHGVRSCYIGMQIARALQLSSEERVNLYYAELLKDAGCTAYTSQLASFWLTDEIAAKSELQFFRDPSSPLNVLSWAMQYVAAGMSFPTRATRLLDFMKNGQEFMREGFESTCLVATRIAQRLGMPEQVQVALMQIFEQWNGKGMPHGASGQEIPLISRIVLLTSFLEVYHRLAGREGAQGIALTRRGKAFDPAVVDAFLSVADKAEFWEELERENLWETVRAIEPEESPHRYIPEDHLTDAVLAIADYADMKSPFLSGHSRRVAEVAERIVRRMSLPEPQVVAISRAALVHDIGIVAVPSFVLNKPGSQLTQAEWEQVRLHPYHSERILSKVAPLEAILPMVGAHHERIDGHGYPRGLAGIQIPLGARIIAVADRFDELSCETPDHPATGLEEVVELMRQEAGASLSPEAVQALLEDLGGGSVTSRRRTHQPWPRELTDREVEVLRLMARGLSRNQAAKALIVSEGTIRSHLEHVYSKIGVSNRAAATLFAIEHGLLN